MAWTRFYEVATDNNDHNDKTSLALSYTSLNLSSNPTLNPNCCLMTPAAAHRVRVAVPDGMDSILRGVER